MTGHTFAGINPEAPESLPRARRGIASPLEASNPGNDWATKFGCTASWMFNCRTLRPPESVHKHVHTSILHPTIT